MKTIIIGARGMLGQELAKVFAGNELLLWDREDLDIADAAAVKNKINATRPELIINAAAYNNVDGCEENFELAKKINGDAPVFLAQAAEAVGAIFVHYSTDYVFSGDKGEPYVETDDPRPLSKYGESKLLGERAREFCSRCYLIRTSRLFGAPALSEGAKKSFVDVMLTLAQTKNELDIVHEEVSAPTYAKDLAEYTRILIDEKYPFGIYHGVNDGGCTWFELAAEAFRLCGVNVIMNSVPAGRFSRPARRPAYSVLKNTRGPKMRRWQDALAEYLYGEAS